ncbi:MAG: DUF2142 domain-containing protein [Ilumatobacteraceae bacterium]
MVTLGRRLRSFAPDVGFFAVMLLLILTWLVAVPRWAVPDEPAHVFKALGTADGQWLGQAIETEPPTPSNYRRYVGPAQLGLGDVRCYFGDEDIPAGCDVGNEHGFVSSAARYPPYYYAVVGGAARLVGQTDSVRVYRLASALICTAALTVAFALIRRSKARRLAPLMLVALTPMALFMLASVNPNATEIAGFILVWALLARMCTDDELSKSLTLATSVIAAVLVASRPISAVWLACIGVVVLIAAAPDRRRTLLCRPYLIRIVVPLAISVVASLAWLRYASFEIGDASVATDLRFGTVARLSVEAWPLYYRQTIGVLGWLDTDLPVITYVGWTLALVAVATLYLRGASSRNWLTLAALVAAWLALPLVINAFTAADAGLSFQGRYSLPILAGVAFLPMLDTRNRRTPGSVTTMTVVALAVISVAEIAGFWQMLRRFSVGAHGKIWLVGGLPWHPGVAPMVLIAVNAMTMIALCVGTVVVTRSHPQCAQDGHVRTVGAADHSMM